MTGGMPRQPLLPGWAAGLDAPQGKARPVGRPAPHPPADQRPKKISVTAVDKLKADPYEFYAKHNLRLVRRDPVDVRSEERRAGEEGVSTCNSRWAAYY